MGFWAVDPVWSPPQAPGVVVVVVVVVVVSDIPAKINKNPGFSGLAGYPQSGAPTPHARGQRTNQKSIKNPSKINQKSIKNHQKPKKNYDFWARGGCSLLGRHLAPQMDLK